MNKQLENLMYKSGLTAQGCWDKMDNYDQQAILEFAQLIVEECRTVISDVYRKTPLEFCGPLLAADQALAEHFYRVEP